MAPRARFELATLRLTAEEAKILNALSGVAYKKLGAIFPFLVAPNPAPKLVELSAPGLAKPRHCPADLVRGSAKGDN